MKIVYLELAPTLETHYVVKAIREAIQRTGARSAVMHTYRGVQCTFVSYWDETEGIQKSYPSKVSLWGNTCI